MSRIVPDRLKPLYDGAANLSDPWCLCFEPDEECVYVVMWNPEEEKWEKKEPITHIMAQSGHPLVVHIICKFDLPEEEDFGVEYIFLITNCDTSMFNLKADKKTELNARLESFRASQTRPNKFRFIQYISRLFTDFIEAILDKEGDGIEGPAQQGQGGLCTPGGLSSRSSGEFLKLFYLPILTAVFLREL